jgi:hypothetical protein
MTNSDVAERLKKNDVIRKSGLIPQDKHNLPGKLRLPSLPRFKQHTTFKNLVLNPRTHLRGGGSFLFRLVRRRITVRTAPYGKDTYLDIRFCEQEAVASGCMVA